MKICILTFHAEINYGANLQAYALSQYLSSIGHEVTFIDYRKKRGNVDIINIIKCWIGRTPKLTLEKIRRQIINKKLVKIFRDFQGKNFKLTPVTYTSLRMLLKSPPEADCYIVGSDQIWSTKIIDEGELPIYMLAFGDNRTARLAYAASSGGEIFSSDIKSNVAKYLSKFHAIGVREEPLATELKELGLNNVHCVPDPTILIDWSNYFGFNQNPENTRSGRALFILNQANYAKITHSGIPANLHKDDISKKFTNLLSGELSPENWVKSIASQEILITDSYHAVLFAVYTKTPFYYISWGEASNRDVRILYFLRRIDLSERMVSTIDIEKIPLGSDYSSNWEDVHAHLQNLRGDGLSFLDAYLNSVGGKHQPHHY